MNKILIENAKIINPGGAFEQFGDICIDNGIISYIGDKVSNDADIVIDAAGMVAAPGLVDMHVHMRDPGFTYKDDIITVGECAAAGGITSLAAMPNTNPAADCEEIIKYIKDKSEKSKVRVYPVGAITKALAGKELTDFVSLKNAGAVALSDDGEPVSTSKLMLETMKKTAGMNMNILAHCEDKDLICGGIVNEGIVSETLGVKGNPTLSESIGVIREITLAKSANARIHICHVSTASSIEFIKYAKSKGVKVTAETCPHYFVFNEEYLMNKDADYRMNPPLRTEQDRLEIIQAIIDGTIDSVATDHAPHTREEKSGFYDAPNGVIGLETSLAAGITYLVNKGYISLYKLIDMMSTVPANILGIEAGNIKVGAPADIVVFDAAEHWTVDPYKLHGKSINTPFKGMDLCGRVKYTICRGEIVYKD